MLSYFNKIEPKLNKIFICNLNDNKFNIYSIEFSIKAEYHLALFIEVQKKFIKMISTIPFKHLLYRSRCKNRPF